MAERRSKDSMIRPILEEYNRLNSEYPQNFYEPKLDRFARIYGEAKANVLLSQYMKIKNLEWKLAMRERSI